MRTLCMLRMQSAAVHAFVLSTCTTTHTSSNACSLLPYLAFTSQLQEIHSFTVCVRVNSSATCSGCRYQTKAALPRPSLGALTK